MFEKGRGFRVDDNQIQDLHLEPGRGAAIGEYAHPESSEYSDSYYGPGREPRRSDANRDSLNRGITRAFRPVHSRNHITPEHFGSGELGQGQRSWADLGVSSVHRGESGITEGAENHRGRGPKGYRRSDDRIRELVCERLTDDPHIDASQIEVKVENGEIQLEGFVTDRRAKWWAEELAHRVTGTTDVQNRLRVKQ
jgi:hypothetical protein